MRDRKGVTETQTTVDHALSQMVRERLQQDRRTAGVTVDICCTEGCICLIGHVDCEEQKAAALFLVEGMTGITTIQDNIVVRNMVI